MGGGDDSIELEANARVTGNVDLGAGNDTITHAGNLAGDITGGAGNHTFNIRNALTGNVDGGGGNDTFTLTATLTGDITGGAGSDHLDLENRRDLITITLTAHDASGFESGAVVGGRFAAGVLVDSNIIGGFTGIDELTGWEDIDAFNALQGHDVAAWALGVDAQGDERNTYAVGTQSLLTFRGFQTLIGGSMADTFTFGNMDRLGRLSQSNRAWKSASRKTCRASGRICRAWKSA